MIKEKSIGLGCVWTVKERIKLPISHREIWHPVLQRENTFTTVGLTNLASAISGNYSPPLYLALNSNYTTILAAISVGATTVITNTQIDQSGDTQIILGLGLSNQESVTFTSSAANTGGPGWVYTLASGTTYAHSVGDPVTRQPNQNDSLTNIAAEQQYDSVNSPLLRAQSIAGYSGGAGNWVTQFYFVSTTANFYISDVGLTDNVSIGAGELHNHVALGYDHTSGATDLEIDGNLTLTNM